MFEALWGHAIQSEPGLRIPNMFDAAIDGHFKGLFVQGEDIAQSDPNTVHVMTALRSLELLVVQDLFINETAKLAHVFFPGTSFLEKDGTFTNAERRINRVRPVMRSRCGKQEWELACELSAALGAPMHYDQASEIMDEIAALTPTFAGVSFAKLDEVGSVQWPCNDREAAGHADHARGHVRAWPRQVQRHAVRAHRGALQPPLPAAADHRPHPQPVQRRRPDPSHQQRRAGTPRTSSRSIRTTPRSAASPTATRSRWPAGSARPRCTRWSPIACPRASSTPRSTIRSAAPTS